VHVGDFEQFGAAEVRDFMRDQPDRARGLALAALTAELVFQAAKPAMICAAVDAREDPILFRWSREFAADAEHVALYRDRGPS